MGDEREIEARTITWNCAHTLDATIACWECVAALLDRERALLRERDAEVARLMAALDALWTEWHYYDDHREDGFGEMREQCDEYVCRRMRATVQDGQAFKPDSDAMDDRAKRAALRP